MPVDGAEVSVQLLGFWRGGGVDEGGVDGVRGALGGGSDEDVVDEVPAPVVDDLEGVGALVQQDLAAGDGGEGGGGGEGDFGGGAVVEDHGGALVAVGTGVADREVVQLGGGGGDLEGDLVGAGVEAADVAGAGKPGLGGQDLGSGEDGVFGFVLGGFVAADGFGGRQGKTGQGGEAETVEEAGDSGHVVDPMTV